MTAVRLQNRMIYVQQLTVQWNVLEQRRVRFSDRTYNISKMKKILSISINIYCKQDCNRLINFHNAVIDPDDCNLVRIKQSTSTDISIIQIKAISSF